MLIQFWHAKEGDYVNELYIPIKENNSLQSHTIILPHDGDVSVNSRQTLQDVDIFFAEVSYPATGLWIELWFAALYGTTIVCFSRKWVKIAWSLRYICKDFFEYEDADTMIHHLEERIATYAHM